MDIKPITPLLPHYDTAESSAPPKPRSLIARICGFFQSEPRTETPPIKLATFSRLRATATTSPSTPTPLDDALSWYDEKPPTLAAPPTLDYSQAYMEKLLAEEDAPSDHDDRSVGDLIRPFLSSDSDADVEPAQINTNHKEPRTLHSILRRPSTTRKSVSFGPKAQRTFYPAQLEKSPKWRPNTTHAIEEPTADKETKSNTTAHDDYGNPIDRLREDEIHTRAARRALRKDPTSYRGYFGARLSTRSQELAQLRAVGEGLDKLTEERTPPRATRLSASDSRVAKILALRARGPSPFDAAATRARRQKTPAAAPGVLLSSLAPSQHTYRAPPLSLPPKPSRRRMQTNGFGGPLRRARGAHRKPLGELPPTS